MLLEDLKNVSSYFENDESINVTLKNIDDLYDNICIIKNDGYDFLGDSGNFNFLFKRNNKIVKLIVESPLKLDLKMPEYDRSMLALTSSLKKYYGLESKYASLKELDDILNQNKPKHILFMILDGLGPYILKMHLKKSDFLYKNMIDEISAVFPPTTACAIPCSASSRPALETGWIGWENYFNDIDRDLIMFMGLNYKTGESTGINVREKYLPYDDYFYQFDTFVSDLEPAFKPNGFKDITSMLNKFVDITKTHDKSFTYAYWDEPDHSLHEFGVTSDEVCKVINSINSSFEKIKEQLLEDTLLIITADHGHQDVNRIKLYEYEEVTSMLNRSPSNEGRCLFFSVKEEYKEIFKDTFNKYFKSIYDIYTKEEFLEKGFLGDYKKIGVNKYLNSFLADFVGVAKSNYYFEYVISDHVFKSAHAGITSNEMITPLIIYKK